MLDLESVRGRRRCSSNSLSIIREKAAARHIRLEHGRRRGAGLDPGRRAQGQADRLQPALQRREVHRRRRPGDAARAAASRAPRSAGVAGAWAGRTFPLADNEFAEFLEISVTDTGIGISPEELEQLFKPFSQIDSGLARKFEGTGLGPGDGEAARRAARRQRSRWRAPSGEGSCFTVWLPFRAAERRGADVGDGRGATHGATRAGRAHRAGRRGRLQVRRADPRAARGGRLHGAARRRPRRAALAARGAAAARR